jgi:hypothetical protein
MGWNGSRRREQAWRPARVAQAVAAEPMILAIACPEI